MDVMGASPLVHRVDVVRMTEEEYREALAERERFRLRGLGVTEDTPR